MAKLNKYVYTEVVHVRVLVEAANEDLASEAGSEYVDALLYDSLTLVKRAKEIEKRYQDCTYIETDSTGDSEVEEYDPSI